MTLLTRLPTELAPTVGRQVINPVVDHKLAALAEQYAAREEPLPPGRWGATTRADLDATIYRIIHGVKKGIGDI